MSKANEHVLNHFPDTPRFERIEQQASWLCQADKRCENSSCQNSSIESFSGMLFVKRGSKHAGFSAGHVRFLVDILSYSCWFFPRYWKIRHPISYRPNFHWCWQPSNPTSSCCMSKFPSLAAPIPFFPCFNKSSPQLLVEKHIPPQVLPIFAR